MANKKEKKTKDEPQSDNSKQSDPSQDKSMVTEIVIEEDNSEGSEKSDFKDSEIWTMTPQQSADLKALHESIQLGTAEEEEKENQRNDEHITNNTHTAETISSVQSQPASFSISTQTSTATATTTTTTATTTNIEDTRPAVGTEEWHRRRRESHKLVERKRREAINEGINEIAQPQPTSNN
ncbi:Putative Helix-loop-helix protein [Rhizopus microsporus]|nr:Putative Helix-loop-helix protein [Rhizopus microsporus]